MIPWFRTMQKSVDEVNRILREQITGIRVVRLRPRGTSRETRFDEGQPDLYPHGALRRPVVLDGLPLVMLVFNLASVAVLWFGAHRVDAGRMEVGALTAFMTYLVQILMSVMFGVMMSMMIPRAAVSAGRIAEVLQTASSVSSIPRRPSRSRSTPDVDLRQVTFAYPGADAPVLTDISSRPGPVDDGDRRLDGVRQEHPDLARPAAV